MTRPMPKDDPRLDAIVDFMHGHKAGLTSQAMAEGMKLNFWLIRRALHTLRVLKRLVPVYGGPEVIWATPKNAAVLERKLRAATSTRVERQRARRAARRVHDGHWSDAYSEMAVRQVVATSWAPVRQAPGPTSVFDLGARHA